MMHKNQRLQNKVFCLATLMIAGMTVACQTPPPTPISPSASVSASPGLEVYRHEQFQFSYPVEDFVVDPLTQVPPNESALISAVEVWSQEHYRKIKAGEYAGGTEYPANVQIAVYQNPQRLELQRWVQQSNRFSIPTQFIATTIAGEPGIAFQSTGLYEHEHVAFNSSDTEIILITLSKTGYSNHDANYRTAFDQIIRSFEQF